VADAVARLDGPRIKALVIPKRDGENHVLLEDALRARAARDLPAPARPDRYLFEAALPVNSMGKPVNW
jgi:acyl-coenzyme A synthetase/AMP-(fatty) acid ligase